MDWKYKQLDKKIIAAIYVLICYYLGENYYKPYKISLRFL